MRSLEYVFCTAAEAGVTAAGAILCYKICKLNEISGAGGAGCTAACAVAFNRGFNLVTGC